MATILLGTTSPRNTPSGTSVLVNDEESKTTEDSSAPKSVVIIDTPDTDTEGDPIPLDKQLLEVRNAFALHGGGANWVEGQDSDFTKNVSQIFNCKVGRPGDWDAPKPPQESYKAPQLGEVTRDED